VTDAESLRRLLIERSVRRGDFVLAAGQRSTYYIDCRLATMSAAGMVLIGRLGLAAIGAAGWRPAGIGGLTMGADPVAYAIVKSRRTTAPAARSRGTSSREWPSWSSRT
jgi:orotate phosphoribosyltransferase